MTKPFKELRKKMSSEANTLSARIANELSEEIRLAERRNALGVNKMRLLMLSLVLVLVSVFSQGVKS